MSGASRSKSDLLWLKNSALDEPLHYGTPKPIFNRIKLLSLVFVHILSVSRTLLLTNLSPSRAIAKAQAKSQSLG